MIEGNNLTIKDISSLLSDKSVRDELLALAKSNQANLYSEDSCTAEGKKHPVLRPSKGVNNTFTFKGITFQICICTTCERSFSVPIEPHKFEQLKKN